MEKRFILEPYSSPEWVEQKIFGIMWPGKLKASADSVLSAGPYKKGRRRGKNKQISKMKILE